MGRVSAFTWTFSDSPFVMFEIFRIWENQQHVQEQLWVCNCFWIFVEFFLRLFECSGDFGILMFSVIMEHYWVYCAGSVTKWDRSPRTLPLSKSAQWCVCFMICSWYSENTVWNTWDRLGCLARDRQRVVFLSHSGEGWGRARISNVVPANATHCRASECDGTRNKRSIPWLFVGVASRVRFLLVVQTFPFLLSLWSSFAFHRFKL